MFDTHCHLNYSVFDDILGKVIDDAREVGVKYFMIPGTNLGDSKIAIKIANNFQNVYAAVGIHPTEDLESLDLQSCLIKLDELLDEEKVLAVGEIGLDYYRFKSPASVQKEFFREQVKLASRKNVAIIIHNRQSSSDVVKILDEIWAPHMDNRVVFHCSEVSDEVLDFALKRSIYIGVDGDVTYDNKKSEFIKKVPLDLLVLETDSPFLTPDPARQTNKFPNEPKNLIFIAEKIAEIKGEKVESIAQITTQNALTLFNIDKNKTS